MLQRKGLPVGNMPGIPAGCFFPVGSRGTCVIQQGKNHPAGPVGRPTVSSGCTRGSPRYTPRVLMGIFRGNPKKNENPWLPAANSTRAPTGKAWTNRNSQLQSFPINRGFSFRGIPRVRGRKHPLAPICERIRSLILIKWVH